jgi:uncharacterized membrane protein YfcA
VSGEFGAALVVIFLAGITNGLTGFGFALIAVPPLLLIYDPKTVVAVRLLLSLSGGWVPLVNSWRSIETRTLVGAIPWAYAGLFLGIRLLEHLPAAGIKLLASVVVIGFALLLLRGRVGGQSSRARSKRAAAIAGLASGTLSTSTGLSGPPIIMLFTLRGYGVQAFRATILSYVLLLDAVGLPALIASGAVHESQLRIAALLTPAAYGGRFAGMALVRRVSPMTFRRATLVLLIATGSIGAIDAVIALT